MQTTICYVFLIGCLVLTGCNDESPPGQRQGEVISQLPSETSENHSIPRLDPKPVVWIADWKGIAKVPRERGKSQAQVLLADRLKSVQKFDMAEKQYLLAIETDPTWAYPCYQLACNYELWNKHSLAVSQFRKAVDLGFDDFPIAIGDDELGQLRDGPEFRNTLARIRERYVVNGKAKVGQPIAVRPTIAKPADGWPVLLMLHGYGDTNVSFLNQAEQFADLGFLAVAVPGSIPTQNDRYQWSMDSIDPTHQDMTAIIHSQLFQGLANLERVFLLGFSQGALHAMLLTAEYSDIYAGVVGMSPGGSLASQLSKPSLNRTNRSARCMFIHGEQEPYDAVVKSWSVACKEAGWKFQSKTHPGGHQFPDDWNAIYPEIARFLTD